MSPFLLCSSINFRSYSSISYAGWIQVHAMVGLYPRRYLSCREQSIECCRGKFERKRIPYWTSICTMTDKMSKNSDRGAWVWALAKGRSDNLPGVKRKKWNTQHPPRPPRVHWAPDNTAPTPPPDLMWLHTNLRNGGAPCALGRRPPGAQKEIYLTFRRPNYMLSRN